MIQQIILGDECVSKVHDLVSCNEWNKVLLVTGKQSFESSGAEKFINDCLYGCDVETIRFCDFSNNPNISDLKRGLILTRQVNPSAIVAIGGGSVMDMGKLLRFFMTHEGEILTGPYTFTGRNLPLFSIPTTAGTGAEATHFAVLYDEQGRKYSIADRSILPDHAVIYPLLTYGQSPYITACSGFDALAQSIEAYWNKKATKESDVYAEKAMDLLYSSLRDAVSNPTKEIRGGMAEGAYWAGRAINITKTTAPHAFSYPFTSHYGIPHGHAVAIVFPIIAEFNLTDGDIAQKKKDKIFSLFGGQELFLSNMNKFVFSIGLEIPKNMDFNMNLLLDGINLERLANNPVNITISESQKLLEKILGCI